MIGKLLIGALAPVLVSACAAAGTGGGAPGATEPARAEPGAVLVAASSDGAIVADPADGTLRGFDRSGRRRWTDRRALSVGADAICAERCPDAVVSGSFEPSGPDPEPWLIEGGEARGLPVSRSSVRRVLSARSASDAVIQEETRLRLLRDGEPDIHIPLGHDVTWAENPERTEAAAFARGADGPAPGLMRFRRDGAGWRPAGSAPPPEGEVLDACAAGEGSAQTVLLAGTDSALVFADGRRVPVRTDLAGVGECGLGEAGGFVLGRTIDQSGRRRTAVRAIDAQGSQIWSRDLECEASAAAHPTDRLVALACDGRLRLVNANGWNVGSSTGVASVRFTAAGELVTLGTDGRVRWRHPGDLR